MTQHKYIIIIFVSLLLPIFSACTKKNTVKNIPSYKVERTNQRVPISVCRSSTRFIDKYTTPNTEDCHAIWNGIRNKQKKILLSAKHLFHDKQGYYFAQIHSWTLTSLSQRQAIEPYDLIVVSFASKQKNAPSFPQTRTGQKVMSKLIQTIKGEQIVYGTITHISWNIATTNLSLSPWMSGSPLFNASGDLIWINIAIDQTHPSISYTLLLQKEMFSTLDLFQ